MAQKAYDEFNLDTGEPSAVFFHSKVKRQPKAIALRANEAESQRAGKSKNASIYHPTYKASYLVAAAVTFKIVETK